MTIQYVRDMYRVPAGRWVVVRPLSGTYQGDELIITSCSHLVHARHPFSPRVLRFHPADLEYKTSAGWVRAKLEQREEGGL